VHVRARANLLCDSGPSGGKPPLLTSRIIVP
jgi:hypothetical protein